MNIGRLLLAALCVCGPVSGVSASGPEPDTLRLGIDEMFAIADENNSAIRSYAFAESAASEAVQSALKERLPSLDFSASASYLGDAWISDRNFGNGMNAPMPHFGNNFAAEAAYVVYAGGAVSTNIALSRLKLESVRADAESNRQNVRFMLAGCYLELCKLDNYAEVYRRNIALTRRMLADIRARYGEGLAIRNDITRYELQLQSLEVSLTQTLNTRAIVNDRLAVALGLGDGVRIEPDRSVADELPSMQSETAWQSRAAEAPVLRGARLGVEQSREGIKLARSARIPSLSLFAGDHFDGPILVEVPPLNKNLNYWYVGVGLKFSISSLWKSGRSIRRAKFDSQRAEMQARMAEENLHSDVREAYIRFDESFTVAGMYEKKLQLAEQNYEVVRNRFLNDLALITDMLDADSERLDAELGVANARIGILFSYYRLKRASGDL